MRQRGAGGGVCMSAGRASEGSARERPGMFWNSDASLAGGGDVWGRSQQASGAAEDDLPQERWAPWEGSC